MSTELRLRAGVVKSASIAGVSVGLEARFRGLMCELLVVWEGWVGKECVSDGVVGCVVRWGEVWVLIGVALVALGVEGARERLGGVR